MSHRHPIIKQRLERIYGTEKADHLLPELCDLLRRYAGKIPARPRRSRTCGNCSPIRRAGFHGALVKPRIAHDEDTLKPHTENMENKMTTPKQRFLTAMRPGGIP